MNFSEVDLSKLKTYPLCAREHKVNIEQFVRPEDINLQINIENMFPRILAADSLRELAHAIVTARRLDKPVVFAMGSHVIKCGLSLLIIDLMKRGILTALAFNGSAIVHDLEITLIGATSEDVAEQIKQGRFGMAEETGSILNKAIKQGYERGLGLGESVGKWLANSLYPHKEYSIFANAYKLGIPVTVHVAIGTDIIHMHPSASGAAIGECSHRDFKKLCGVVGQLEGGVWVNLGSAVVLPEVFLKAVSVARNLGAKLESLFTANLDMLQHYRPLQNVVKRPLLPDGKGITITGHHEIMIPLLYQMIVRAYEIEP